MTSVHICKRSIVIVITNEVFVPLMTHFKKTDPTAHYSISFKFFFLSLSGVGEFNGNWLMAVLHPLHDVYIQYGPPPSRIHQLKRQTILYWAVKVSLIIKCLHVPKNRKK